MVERLSLNFSLTDESEYSEGQTRREGQILRCSGVDEVRRTNKSTAREVGRSQRFAMNTAAPKTLPPQSACQTLDRE